MFYINRAPMLALMAIIPCLLTTTATMALPETQLDFDTKDDATVTLTMRMQAITGDSKTFCELEIEVSGNDVELRSGDTIEVEVYENDPLSSESFYGPVELNPTTDELNAQLVSRTIDCSAPIGDNDDNDDTLEFVAILKVDKDDCGYTCWNDEPETGELIVTFITDDASEDDDSAEAANGPMGQGDHTGYIARDSDWFRIDIAEVSALEVTLSYLDNVGVIAATIFAADAVTGELNEVASGTFADDSTVAQNPGVPTGSYYVEATPTSATNYNFYDLGISITPLPPQFECAPDSVDTDTSGCSFCKSRFRTCTADGEWSEFGTCEGDGVCEPGDTRNSACGNCGIQVETCANACVWEYTENCGNQGECTPGEQTTDNCVSGPGSRMRECSSTCTWGNFSSCAGTECSGAHNRTCYSGPRNTGGVGICQQGTQSCLNGFWQACVGEVGPGIEFCADGLDNDCDGQTDLADTDCAAPPTIGDACIVDPECPPHLRCLAAPTWGVFTGGYCGLDNCGQSCGEGGACGLALGSSFCLKICTTNTDCRDGYSCISAAVASTPTNLCVPHCRNDADCPGASNPTCGTAIGQCVAGPGLGPTEPSQSIPAGNGASAGAPIQSDSGVVCQAANSSALTLLLLGMYLFGLRLRPSRNFGGPGADKETLGT